MHCVCVYVYDAELMRSLRDRIWWLLNIPVDSPDRPPYFSDHTTHIVQQWNFYPGSKVTINVYSDSPTVELFVNGVTQGRQSLIAPALGGPSYASYPTVEYQAGNITAVGLSVAGLVQSQDVVFTPGVPVALQLTVDAPSASTGTGSALFADGQVDC